MKICKDCPKDHYAKGYCKKHYHAEYRKNNIQSFRKYSLDWARKNPEKRSAWNAANKDAVTQYKKYWHLNNKKSLKGRLINRYWPDLTPDQAEQKYFFLLQEQRGLCAICHQPETSLDPRSQAVRALSVDHCHESGKVRGLLCYKCNHGLGCFSDDPVTLQIAISYIKGELCQKR